jgi:hypothetical protein
MIRYHVEDLIIPIMINRKSGLNSHVERKAVIICTLRLPSQRHLKTWERPSLVDAIHVQLPLLGGERVHAVLGEHRVDVVGNRGGVEIGPPAKQERRMRNSLINLKLQKKFMLISIFKP